jgi:hypothetical protein
MSPAIPNVFSNRAENDPFAGMSVTTEGPRPWWSRIAFRGCDTPLGQQAIGKNPEQGRQKSKRAFALIPASSACLISAPSVQRGRRFQAVQGTPAPRNSNRTCLDSERARGCDASRLSSSPTPVNGSFDGDPGKRMAFTKYSTDFVRLACWCAARSSQLRCVGPDEDV